MGHRCYHNAHITDWYYFLAGPEGAATRRHFGQRGWQEHFLARAELNRQITAGEMPEVDYSTWLKYTPKNATIASHTRITTVKHTPSNIPADHCGKPLSAQPEAEESIHARSSLSKAWNTSKQTANPYAPRNDCGPSTVSVILWALWDWVKALLTMLAIVGAVVFGIWVTK